MEKIIPFKNIRVSNDLDSLMRNIALPMGTVMVIMCKQGRLRIEADRQGYEMHEHDIMLCMPDFLAGNYMYTPDFKCLIFCVQQEAINDVVYSCLRAENNWYDKLQYIRHHHIIHMNEHQIAIYDAYQQLIDLHIRKVSPYQDRISDALAQAIIFEILYMVEESMRKNENCADSPAIPEIINNKSRVNQLFYRFVQLLEANHTSRRSVRWYANEMAITPKYLTYICKQVTGKTPTDVINSIAIREIKLLLLNTNDTVKEIAYTMNYVGASSFCKFFRLQTGMSPQAFRRQNRKQQPQKP